MATHVSTVDLMLTDNRKIFAKQKQTDYIVLCFSETKEEADKIANEIQEVRNDIGKLAAKLALFSNA